MLTCVSSVPVPSLPAWFSPTPLRPPDWFPHTPVSVQLGPRPVSQFFFLSPCRSKNSWYHYFKTVHFEHIRYNLEDVFNASHLSRYKEVRKLVNIPFQDSTVYRLGKRLGRVSTLFRGTGELDRLHGVTGGHQDTRQGQGGQLDTAWLPGDLAS